MYQEKSVGMQIKKIQSALASLTATTSADLSQYTATKHPDSARRNAFESKRLLRVYDT
jgi:hypothetical protein